MVATVKVEDNKAAVQRFKVNRIPTWILFKDGVEKDRSIGVRSESGLRKWLNSVLPPEKQVKGEKTNEASE